MDDWFFRMMEIRKSPDIATKEEIVKMAEDIIYMMYSPPAMQNVASYGNKLNEEMKAESHEKLVG
jgi:hypothetical protein